MDANTANTEAAKKRIAQLKEERDAVQRRITRDTATLTTIDVQLAALEASLPAEEPAPATDTAVS